MNFDEAEKHYLKALDISSTNSEFYLNLGYVLERQFKFDQALKANEQA